MGSVVVAYGVAWTALMVFVLSMARRQKQMDRQIEALRHELER